MIGILQTTQRTFCILLCVCVLCAPGVAQIIIETEDSYPESAFRREANKEGIDYWPNFTETTKGFRIAITVDLSSASLVLSTHRSFDLEVFERLAGDVARTVVGEHAEVRIGGTKTRHDALIDFSEKIERVSLSESAIYFRVDELAHVLRHNGLSEDVVIGIRLSRNSIGTLLEPGRRPSSVGEFLFRRLGEIPDGLELVVHTKLPASAYAGASFAVLLAIVAVCAPWLRIRSSLRKPVDPLSLEPDEDEDVDLSVELDQDKVQKAYDRSLPEWLWVLPFVLGALICCGAGMTIVPDSLELLRAWNPNTVLVVAALIAGSYISSGIVRFVLAAYARRRAPEQRPWPLPWARLLLGPAACLMFMLPLLSDWIKRLDSSPPVQLAILIALTASSFIFVLYLVLQQNPLRPVVMPEGNEHRDRVVRLAEKAGVKVRKVSLLRVDSPNATASTFGRIGLTRGLLKKFTPEEVDVVVAHELGHLKNRHPLKMSLISAGVIIGSAAVWMSIGERILRGLEMPDEVRRVLSSPICVIVLLAFLVPVLFGRISRRNELEADKFAVELTGDPELVANTLEKMHRISNVPYRLKKSDESLHSHPSLTARLEAIRRISAQDHQDQSAQSD